MGQSVHENVFFGDGTWFKLFHGLVGQEELVPPFNNRDFRHFDKWGTKRDIRLIELIFRGQVFRWLQRVVNRHCKSFTIKILQVLSDLFFTHHFTSFDVGSLLDKIEAASSALFSLGGHAWLFQDWVEEPVLFMRLILRMLCKLNDLLKVLQVRIFLRLLVNFQLLHLLQLHNLAFRVDHPTLRIHYYFVLHT